LPSGYIIDTARASLAAQLAGAAAVINDFHLASVPHHHHHHHQQQQQQSRLFTGNDALAVIIRHPA